MACPSATRTWTHTAMPNFSDTRERFTPSPTHPVTEALSRYLAMTAPDRSRPGAKDRTSPRYQTASSDRSVQIRVEELWDTLGDFA